MRLSKARKEIVTAVMKDTICDAAESVLEQHGIGGITMDRVAATAGLTAGSLYNYFRNKEELLRLIIARLVEPFFKSMEEIAHATLTAPDKLEKIIRVGWQQCTEERGLIRLLVDSGQDREVRSQARPRALQIFAEIFAQGIRDGSFPPHNPAHSSRIFHGGMAGLFDLQVEGTPSSDVKEYVETLIVAARNAFSIHSPAIST